MKKLLYLFAGLWLFSSCNDKKADNPATPEVVSESNTANATQVEKSKPTYLSQVKYSDWEMGKPENIKPVIDFYSAWDNKDSAKMSTLFADSIVLRIPGEKQEIVVGNSEINSRFIANRSMYATTTSNIISAVSLHDRERNEDWVMVTVYSKWVETNGRRDSVLYSDNWRLKDSKLSFMMSFDKVPTKTFLKRNDPK